MALLHLARLFTLKRIENDLLATLLEEDDRTVSELAIRVRVSRPSVYEYLKRLVQKGLIVESLRGNTRSFCVVPPGRLRLAIAEKEQTLASAKKEIEQLQIQRATPRKTRRPRLELFEGREALQQMMKDILLYRDITVYAFWPVEKMVSLLSPSFLEQFHQERIARNIKIQVIWPHDQAPSAKQHSFLNTGFDVKREVRIAPLHVDFSLGYAVYGNTVRFISSSKESFGFLVESDELAQTMRSQFEMLWKTLDVDR